MILPIYALGQPILKKKAIVIEKDHEGLKELISNMWETMYNAEGIGLAGPQVGQGIRIFLIDTEQIKDDKGDIQGFKKVFINAEKIEETGDLKDYEEGCLSIPDIRGDVKRPEVLTLKYMDENFEEKTETFTGLNARVIQHEYDHIEGKLFTEKLKPIKKRMIKRKLEIIKKGMVQVDYKMKFVRS